LRCCKRGLGERIGDGISGGAGWGCDHFGDDFATRCADRFDLREAGGADR
jgi:hypothetical protein